MELEQAIDRKARQRRDLAAEPIEAKLAALVRMQAMARAMAEAAGRRFEGVVWNVNMRSQRKHGVTR